VTPPSHGWWEFRILRTRRLKSVKVEVLKGSYRCQTNDVSTHILCSRRCILFHNSNILVLLSCVHTEGSQSNVIPRVDTTGLHPTEKSTTSNRRTNLGHQESARRPFSAQLSLEGMERTYIYHQDHG